jgi:hypothetical protein
LAPACTNATSCAAICIVPPETPHKFGNIVNIGDGQLQQVDIHKNKRFIHRLARR